MTPVNQLLSIMQSLRDVQKGCPWDKKQTFDSIVPYTLEETWEVIDAIQRKDFVDLKGELGDLLFQVVFYAQLACEAGYFDFADVCNAISEKLIRRHPHVFAQHAGEDVEHSPRWEESKAAERAEKQRHSALDEIPRAMPALMRAQKMQQRCRAVGFDWQTLTPVLEKVHEEIAEVMHEAQQTPVNEQKLEEEIGDLLFATVNFSRHLGQQAETALQKACNKFERRFRQVEHLMSRRGIAMSQASLQQLEAAWQQVKAEENADNAEKRPAKRG